MLPFLKRFSSWLSLKQSIFYLYLSTRTMTQYNSQSHAMPHSLHSKINKRGFCYFRFLHVFYSLDFLPIFDMSISMQRKVRHERENKKEETPCKLDQVSFTMSQAYYLLYQTKISAANYHSMQVYRSKIYCSNNTERQICIIR